MARTVKMAANGIAYVREGNKYAGQIGGPGQGGPVAVQVAPVTSAVAEAVNLAPSISELYATMGRQVVETTTAYTLDELRVVDPERFEHHLEELRTFAHDEWYESRSARVWDKELEDLGEPGLKVEEFDHENGHVVISGRMRRPSEILVREFLLGEEDSSETIRVRANNIFWGWRKDFGDDYEAGDIDDSDGVLLVARKKEIEERLSGAGREDYDFFTSDEIVLESARDNELEF